MSEILSPQEAASKQKQLVDNGYTIVTNILKDPLLSSLRNWSNDVFNRVPVDPKYKYQGSDIHVYTEKAWKEMGIRVNEKRFPDPIVEELINYPDQKIICTELGLENLKPRDNIILLSKPPLGPPLYWHQDFMNWNHPEAACPWPTVIFLSYYMNNTSRENGCLRVIPGSHRKRDRLHDILPDAHGPEIQSVEDLKHPIFQDHPDSVDVPLNAGDLIIADARLLHAAWPNKTNERRTLVLLWHDVFKFPNPPTWWDKEIPDIVKLTNQQLTCTPSRKPGKYPR
jgi:ectoine hydroxylase-related dioxygenase (phytanoyl-CoA dioxygenase family)